MNLHIMSRLSSFYDRVFHHDHGQSLRRPDEPPPESTTKITDAAPVIDGVSVNAGDDVYDVRTGDLARIDDDDTLPTGENWIEMLEVYAVEAGLSPEQELVIEDDELVEDDLRDTAERPIADFGVGGPRGR
jgi:hypothetical protein